MRPKVENGRKAKTEGVSLSPKQAKFVRRRALQADIGFSRYFQLLAALDEKENLLPRALTACFDKQAA